VLPGENSWLPMQLVRSDEHREPVTISSMHHEIQEPEPAANYSPQFFNADAPAMRASEHLAKELRLSA
jgi:hypothetical protein